MKVFFTTTPRLIKEAPGHIDAIYNAITKSGNVSVSDYLKHVKLDDFYKFNNEKVPVYYEEILDSIKKSDVVVFEASLHSIGVGLLIKEALTMGKGVVILHSKGNYPFFLSSIKEDRFVISEYNLENVATTLSTAFDYLTGMVDVRFNFFISPEIGRFLDWVSKNKRIPRAVYLRKLIEVDMKQNDEYKDE